MWLQYNFENTLQGILQKKVKCLISLITSEAGTERLFKNVDYSVVCFQLSFIRDKYVVSENYWAPRQISLKAEKEKTPRKWKFIVQVPESCLLSPAPRAGSIKPY